MAASTSLTLLDALFAGYDRCVALVGAGGKTTAMAQLARQSASPVILACSTHLGAWQVRIADNHFIIEDPAQLTAIKHLPAGISLFTGLPAVENRLAGLDEQSLAALHKLAIDQGIPFILEADGSRQRPLKAPAAHEPVIPPWVKQVVVVAGLSGLGQPAGDDQPAVFRPGQFTRLAGMQTGDSVTPQHLVRVLRHAQGGLKGIPAHARRTVLLNQADSEDLRETALSMVDPLLSDYDQVLVASLKQEMLYAACRPSAGVILAAGASTRLGRPKGLVEWQGRPLVRIAAESALQAGLSPVVVVLGAVDQPMRAALSGLPVQIIDNPDWQQGQSTSMRAGLLAAQTIVEPRDLGSAMFLLADQPFISPALLRALRDRHRTTLAPVIAPYVGDRRANPVLFDQVTFPLLLGVTGDSGGRAIFQQYPPLALPWEDDRLLLDVDTPADLLRLDEMRAAGGS